MNHNLDKNTAPDADPITMEIIRNALTVVAEQIAARMIRSATSHIIREMEDCSAAIFDAKGRLLAESASIPIHLNCIDTCLKTIIKHYFPLDTWNDGDVIITNDPYAGGGSLSSHHTNDIITYHPVFLDGQLAAIAAITVHHTDVGAAEMGTRGWNTEIEQEGLRVPPVKIVEGREIDQKVFQIMITNTRLSAHLESDLLAQLSTIERAEKEIVVFFERYGRDVVERCFDALIAYTERCMRQHISAIPDGVYTHKEVVLDDGAQGGPFNLSLAITVKGSDISFDFTGTDSQVAGPINSPLSATKAAVAYVVRCITDPDLPNTEGAKEPISIIAPERTLINPQWPAACQQRMVVCHTIVDLVMGALAQAVPERVMADSCGCLYNGVSSIDSQTGKRGTVSEVVPGGIGATASQDGANVLSCHVTNCPIPPIEATEAEAPIQFIRREFYANSGGAGCFRGGLGQVLSYRVLAARGDLHFTSQKSVSLPQGIVGGKPGAGGGWIINEGADNARRLPYAIGDIEALEKNDVVTHYSPGGGGYGNPYNRDIAAVVADIEAGYITAQHARDAYGVQFDADSLQAKRVT